MEVFFKIEVLKSVSEEKLKHRKTIIATKKEISKTKTAKGKKLLQSKLDNLGIKMEALKDYQKSILI